MPLPFPYGSAGDPTPRRVEFRLSPDLVMDFGDDVSHTMTIYEGYALLHAILRLIWLAVFFLMKFSTEHRYPVTTTAEREIGHDIKEKLYYISLNYDREHKSTAESSDKFHTYDLSDRNIISPSAEGFCRTTVLPASFIGIQASGLYDTSFRKHPQEVIHQCRVSKRHDPMAVTSSNLRIF